MKISPHRLPLVTLTCLLLLPAGAEAVTTRVSVNSTGKQANNYNYTPSLSANGRFVAFVSPSTNLVAGDTNAYQDVFVHDRQTGATTRVSVDSAGNQTNDDSYFDPSISADGRFVAFESYASNLVTADTNSTGDIFVRDRQTGITTRVSVDSAGNQANGGSYAVSLSADGRFVAFQSYASNLVQDDTNGQRDIFVHDIQSGITTRVSVDSAGGQANSYSYFSSISADGRFVAFVSFASNLVADDTNAYADIFVHDLQSGATTRVSVDSAGGQANNYSSSTSLSADGRFVAFASFASNLVADDTNAYTDIFVHDRESGATTRVSVNSVGKQANASSYNSSTSLSADGRFVAFDSWSSNLVAGDTNSQRDLFVHDRERATTTRVSVNSAGKQANAASWSPSLSADGRFMAFVSDATNLVAGATNRLNGIFINQFPCDLDADCDDIPDSQDNCLYVANGPAAPDAGGYSQRDSNGDGFGNVCDADLNNDGLTTVAEDYVTLYQYWNTTDPDADLNGDGLVNILDYRMLRSFLNQAPGPSSLVP